MEKNQNETGMTLSFLRSDAIHWTRKRMEKNACPKKPTDSQRCSVLIIVNPSPVLVTRLGAGATEPCQNSTASPYRRQPEGCKEFCGRRDPSVRRSWTRCGGRFPITKPASRSCAFPTLVISGERDQAAFRPPSSRGAIAGARVPRPLSRERLERALAEQLRLVQLDEVGGLAG